MNELVPPAERGRLTEAQIKRLLKPIRADRVEQKQGLSYIPQHEVRAELMRIFGPGNVDHTMTNPELLYETRLEQGQPQYPTSGNGRPYYVACYKVGCTLRVRSYDGKPVAEFTEWHIEENSPLPNRGEAHAMAATSAESYALRRSAISLGDAFGLHLYNSGSLAPLIAGTLMIEGDLDSPMADMESPINMRLKYPDGVIPPEVQEPAQKPAPRTRAPRKPATPKQAPEAAERPAEPAGEVIPPSALDAAFKKPTEQVAS
jgi:hypothetical protein